MPITKEQKEFLKLLVLCELSEDTEDQPHPRFEPYGFGLKSESDFFYLPKKSSWICSLLPNASWSFFNNADAPRLTARYFFSRAQQHAPVRFNQNWNLIEFGESVEPIAAIVVNLFATGETTIVIYCLDAVIAAQLQQISPHIVLNKIGSLSVLFFSTINDMEPHPQYQTASELIEAAENCLRTFTPAPGTMTNHPPFGQDHGITEQFDLIIADAIALQADEKSALHSMSIPPYSLPRCYSMTEIQLPKHRKTYIFDPKLHADFPDSLPPTFEALLSLDCRALDLFFAADERCCHFRDPWGRTLTSLSYQLHQYGAGYISLIRTLHMIRMKHGLIGWSELEYSSNLKLGKNSEQVILDYLDQLKMYGQPVPQRPRLLQAIIARNQNPNDREASLLHIMEILATDDPNIPDPWGFYAIMIAASYGDEEVFAALLAHGATVNPPPISDLYHDEYHYDVLECAVYGKSLFIVDQVLKASVNIRGPRPFQRAVKQVVVCQHALEEYKAIRLLKLLLDYPVPQAPFATEKTAWDIAQDLARYDRLDLSSLLANADRELLLRTEDLIANREALRQQIAELCLLTPALHVRESVKIFHQRDPSSDLFNLQYQEQYSAPVPTEQKGQQPGWVCKQLPVDPMDLNIINLAIPKEQRRPTEANYKAAFVYTWTHPDNPVENKIDDQVIVNNDFPSGIVQTVYVRLLAAGEIIVEVLAGDQSILRCLEEMFPRIPVIIFGDSHLKVPRLNFDSSTLGQEKYDILINVIEKIDELVHQGLSKAYTDRPSTLREHFERVVIDAIRLSSKEKFVLDSTRGIPEETLLNPFNKYIKVPYSFKTTFDPTQDADFPEQIPGVIHAIILQDLNVLNVSDPRILLQRDAFGRTPFSVARNLYLYHLVGPDLLKELLKKLQSLGAINPITFKKTAMVMSSRGDLLPQFSERNEATIEQRYTFYHQEHEVLPIRPPLHHLIILRNQADSLAAREKIFADIQRGITREDVNKIDPWGFVPLMIAASYGDLAMVQLLIDMAASLAPPDLTDGEQDKTAYDILECAVQSGNPAVVFCLLHHGIAFKNARPFQLAVRNYILANSAVEKKDYLEILRFLMQKKAPQGKFSNGLTPLNLATEVCRLLGDDALLKVILASSYGFVVTDTQTSARYQRSIQIIARHNETASYFSRSKMASPKVAGDPKMEYLPFAEIQTLSIVPEDIDPRKYFKITTPFNNGDFSEIKPWYSLSPAEIAQLNTLYLSKFNQNNIENGPPKFEPTDKTMIEIIKQPDGQISSFFAFEVARDHHESCGEFIWCRFLLAGSGQSGKGLAQMALERIPPAIAKLTSLPVMISFISLYPWLGFSAIPIAANVYPQDLSAVDPALVEYLVKKMGYELVDPKKNPGVVTQAAIASKGKHRGANPDELESPTSLAYHFINQLTQGTERLPFALIYRETGQNLFNAETTHYITEEHQACFARILLTAPSIGKALLPRPKM